MKRAGFKTYVRDGIQLRTGESPRIDVALEVGNVTESVQVTGTAPLLETETSTSGQVLEGGTIEKMPVLQKAFYRIYLYMPGMNVINGQHAVGQRQRSLGFTIDGVNAKESVLGNPNSIDTVVTASLDMIQEFKMYTTGLPAEFGHSSGGQLNGVYKSGTNQLHGSAEDRYLPGKLVHRQYFEQLRRCQGLQVCNPFSYHEMSAIIGGPVVLPKIYNGKDKTFFFGGFQRHHEKVTETFTGTVPTPEMYAGDFSFGGRGFPDLRSRDHTPVGERHMDARSVSGQHHSAVSHRSGDKELSLAHVRGNSLRTPDRSAQRDRQITWSCRARAGITSPDTTPKSITSSTQTTGYTAGSRGCGNGFRDGSSRHTSWRGTCWIRSTGIRWT